MSPPLLFDAERDSTAPPSGVRPSDGLDRARKTIVIVGHGMVGQRMCEEIRARKALARCSVIVFGEEPHLAYDRVHLCEVLRGRPARDIQLVRDQWYEEKRITLVRQDRVTRIDRKEQLVHAESGRVQAYDHLILATGATPFLAKLPGIDGPLVRALRTVDDAQAILHLAQAAKKRGLPVAVLGGGLLGIELAHELLSLGIEVTVFESADYPLSRQLEKSAGSLLFETLKQAGLRIETRTRVTELRDLGPHCELIFEEREPFRAGLVVPAMGIRPRDQLAREAGLRCDLFGGVEVNRDLLTSDPNISAVGECARHEGMAYGLVAPGYAMAEAVARRLAGGESQFEGVQVGTRLKVSGVELTVVGESSARSPWLREHIFKSEGTYRRLCLKGGRVIGITSVGKWEDLPRAQQAMARSEKIKPRQLARFRVDEPMWTDNQLSLHTWPDSATVCTCMGVTCGALRRAQREGCANVEALADATGASTVCGTCRPLLSTLIDDKPEAPDEPSPLLMAFSLLSVLGAILFFVIPEIPYADTVQSQGLDVLWRSRELKQWSGFTLAGLFGLSIVFSMRKRLAWFSLFDFEAWRVAHAFVGVLCLVGGFAHTGFRLGSNLDFALLLVFLGSTLLGGVAGGWTLFESRLSPPRARQFRALLIRSHIYLLWPLPILLAAHITKVYFF